MITQLELKACLSYDRDTGIFFWTSPKKGRKPGAQVGSPNGNGYLRIGINGADYFAHRLAWLYCFGQWPKGVIDHINGNRTDNRLCNLRDVTQVENMLNVHMPRCDNTTGYRGVSLHKQSGRFSARLKAGGKYKHLGLFDSAANAHAAYLAAKASAWRSEAEDKAA